MKITYSSSIDKLCEVNSSFDSGVLKVAYVGRNRNGSSISKETFEKCIKTIYNCPIVCNYNRERDEIGSHDVDVVSKDGAVKLVNITQPVGVIPESAKYWWEKVEDATGVHEYLCVEAIIWKRQEAYEKIKENVITDESMEIKVRSGFTDDAGVYVIESFEFLAFCLLETAEPCYESASLEMFGMDDFRKKYAEMMEEFKQNFKKVNSSLEVDIHPQNYSEGGEKLLEQKMELLAKFGLTVDDLDFDIESMSVEELEMELNKKSKSGTKEDDEQDDSPNDESGNEGDDGDDNDDSEDPSKPEQQSQYSLSGEQFRSSLIDALSSETVHYEWGDMCRYIYCDYDSETCEVYCYDVEDNWNLYGLSFSMNGDNVVIDFEHKKRKKISIVDFDEGDPEFSYKQMFESVVANSVSRKASELNAQFEATKTELEEKYNTASNTIKEMNTELNELRQYKQQKVDDERAADEGAVFAMFADLNGIEAFEALKGNCSELSIDELEDKCFAIRGRNATHTFSAQKQKSTRLPVEKRTMDGEPYGGLFVEFPPKR